MNPDPYSMTSDRLAEIPASLAAVYPASTIGMRRFGIVESDLAVDFSGDDSARLVTRILEQCALVPDGCLSPAFFRELSPGRRLECLVALAVNGEGATFHFPFRCTGCKQEVELEITLEEISEQQRKADRIEQVQVDIDGKILSFRKPCGGDQEAWGRMVFGDRTEALRAMLGALAVGQDPPADLGPEAIDLIDEAMDAADPLVNFFCRASCAECGATNEVFLDLGALALGMLRRRQQQLIGVVHQLATQYHWSEQQIFAIPHWRRREYLDLIAAGG
jgi:hypothetical protein